MSKVAGQIVADHLKVEFRRRKERNEGYSLRAYARDIGTSLGSISEVLSGKREVTQQFAASVLPRLRISPARQDHIMLLFSINSTERSVRFEELDEERHQVIARWYHFAILSLIETKCFQNDSAWISRRLGISTSEAEDAVQRLLALGYLRDVEGKLELSSPNFATKTDVPSTVLREVQHNNLDLAHRSLERDPIEIRDMTAMTMAIDPEKLPLAKKLISEFHRNLSTFLESGERKEVYKLCVQLFPVSEHV